MEGTSFTFVFTDSAEELMDETLYLFPEQKLQAEDGVELTIDNVTLNSVTGEICAETTGTMLSLDKYQYYFAACDSLGNQAEYTLTNYTTTEYEDENGETSVFYTFQNVGNPPSMESEWIEFQLYRLPLEQVEVSAETSSEDEAYETQSEAGTGNVSEEDDYAEGSGAYKVDYAQAVPVGETFRVNLSDAGTTEPVEFYDADGNVSTFRIVTSSASGAGTAAPESFVEEDGSPDAPQAGDVYWEKRSDVTAGYQYVIRSSETGSFMTEELTNDGEKTDGEAGDTVEIVGIRCEVTVSEDGKVMTACEIRE